MNLWSKIWPQDDVEEPKVRIDPSVVVELEENLAKLKETLELVESIRDTRVDTSKMTIAEIDRLIREGMKDS